MARWRIAKARVAWIVGGCKGTGLLVRTIVGSVRFHSMTAFGVGAGFAPGAVSGGPIGGAAFTGDCATAAGAATDEARSTARADSLCRFIGNLSGRQGGLTTSCSLTQHSS